ncbi:hypothetical protein HMSSN036_41720 [Paenibacillus macerans]|nr:hypothetical protein HMSSN036_41720 [Paenibacillus macerans]
MHCFWKITGVILTAGKIIKKPAAECRRLAEIKHLLATARKQRIIVQPEQIEPFAEKVLPGLAKLGKIEIEDNVAGRMVRTQLKAKLYLDRVKDRLLAGLEFQYGDIILTPWKNMAPSGEPT